MKKIHLSTPAAAAMHSLQCRYLLVAAVALASFGTPPGEAGAQVAHLEPALVAARMDEVGIPGLSVAVVRDGDVVWSEGFGWADVENRVPVDVETRFRIASISKALTAAAVGRLHQEGRLDLDAPVQRYVPSFPTKRWPVTTRQIAGHIGGIRHYRGDEFASAVRYDDVVEALSIFREDSLLFEPGTDYSYSTYGWNLVSAVVQGASGRPFLAAMSETVLEPLGLGHTVAEHPDSIIPGRADFYVRSEGGHLLNAPYVDNSNKWAGGGYLSTAEDMARYGSAYFDPSYLEPATVELLWTPQRLGDGSSTGYGIGWSRGEQDGLDAVWHTGGAMGGSTVLLLVPGDRIAVAILTNISSVRHTGTAAALARLFAAP